MTETTDAHAGVSSDQPTPSDSTRPPDDRPLIRASELAEYSFCRRAWWLNTMKGVPSHNQAALARGIQIHHRHMGDVQTASYWRKAGFFLWGGGGLLLIIGAFYYFWP